MGTHEYICSNGHYLRAPFTLSACQVYRLGKPCTGDLRPIGKGSRKAKAEPCSSSSR